MADLPYLKLIRQSDQDEGFFALFVHEGDAQDEEEVVSHLIEEFFFPVDTLISRPIYFEIVAFLKIAIAIFRWLVTPTGLQFQFVLTISLSSANPHIITMRPIIAP